MWVLRLKVRTIFITGLPEDVKERELLNLLRWWPSYEASQVNFKGEKPMGFALFSTAQLVVAAKDALQEMVFVVDDPDATAMHMEIGSQIFRQRLEIGDREGRSFQFTHKGKRTPQSFIYTQFDTAPAKRVERQKSATFKLE
ncbi:RNA-binding protein with multiple splicing 2-like [Juglans microcarpa x Juglans regia]|uniref:RNA-binding protein with multiple splicing 2-like n=1 Tax=Juglans microcarpa x Juglans regia TaxID=2249226 RepID=UPI001B7F3F47|nr:RNA-binding protein with multiple splicing 2-like [Juglans microcarpa x Juglans regia]